MLLQNPSLMGENQPADAAGRPFPHVLRHATDEEYYANARAEREAEDARQLAVAEPVIAAVETRLRQGFPFPRLILETGIRAEVLSQMLERQLPRHFTGHYNMDSRAEVLNQLVAWLDQDAMERRHAALSCATTPTHRHIYNLAMEAKKYGSLEVLVGGVGIGKSWSAEALVADCPRRHNQPGAVLIELRETDKKIGKCLDTLLAGIRGGPHHATGGSAYDLICRELRPGDLVILDEANRLGNCDNGAMVDVIRDLWKDTGAAFFLMGNPILKGKRGVLDNELYDAFASRARIHEVPYNTPADVDTWMVWKGLSGKRLGARFRELAAIRVDAKGNTQPPRPGGLRKLAHIVEDVQRRHPGAELTEDLILGYLDKRGVA